MAHLIPFNDAVLSLDLMDISGENQRDISHNIIKVRLDQTGAIVPNSFSADLRNDVDKMNEAKTADHCGSCYGGLEPASGCCNSCEDVRQAYINRGWSFSNPDAIDQVPRRFFFRLKSLLTSGFSGIMKCKDEGWAEKLREQSNEGCNISGRLRVNKVIGNIHFSPGRSFQTNSRNVYELVPYLRDDGSRHDFSHHIHTFEFQGGSRFTSATRSLSPLRRRR